MDLAFLLLAGLLAPMTVLVVWKKGVAGLGDSLVRGVKILRGVAPLLLMGLALAGFVRVVLPPELVADWMGDEAGIVGLLIGTAAGVFLPGGPYVMMPLLASLQQSGAGVGSLVAFVTAWSLVPLSRAVVWEVPFLGPGLTFVRFGVNLGFPVIAGLLAPPLYRLIT